MGRIGIEEENKIVDQWRKKHDCLFLPLSKAMLFLPFNLGSPPRTI
jgi:hypothetical protein